MNDADVRVVLDAKLHEAYGQKPATEIIHEFGIYGGLHRIDMAVVNGLLAGYEIKSKKDTLKRLPHQARAYSMVFDAMTLIVSENHFHKSLSIIPEWWCVQIAEHTDSGIKIINYRLGYTNQTVKPHAIAALIWRDQAFEILHSHGLAKGMKNSTREKLWDALAYHLSLDELRSATRDAIINQRIWIKRHHCLFDQ